MKVGITSNFTHYIILYFESDWSRICPLPSTTLNPENVDKLTQFVSGSDSLFLSTLCFETFAISKINSHLLISVVLVDKNDYF